MAWGRGKPEDPRRAAVRRARTPAPAPPPEPDEARDHWAEPWDDEPRPPLLRRLATGTARALTGLTLIAAVAAVGFAGGAMLRYLDRVDGFAPPALGTVARADAIAVLTGGSERIAAGGRLLEAGRAGRLLVSGVNEAASERQVRGLLGVGPDLFACCVTLDFAALDTRGNAREIAEWLEAPQGPPPDAPSAADDPPRLIVVTSNYHMERSLLELQRALPGVALDPYPVRGVDLDAEGWWTEAVNWRVLVGEFAKLQLARALDLPVLGERLRASLDLPAPVPAAALPAVAGGGGGA